MAGMVERKMRNLFRQLDVGHRGFMTKAEFVSMAERFCDLENADAAKRESFKAAFTEVYLAFTKFAETTDDRLTESVLVESVLKQQNDPELSKIIENAMHIALSALHVTEDGYLQYEEYDRMFANCGLPDTGNFTRKAFDAIDSDHDGKLSFDQLASAVCDFYLSDDENNPSAIMMGPV